MLFPIVVHKEKESDFGVTIPDIPGCFTAGTTIDEAIANVQEAVECHLEDETDIPTPTSIETHVENTDYAGGVWIMADINFSFMEGKTVRVNITIPKNILHKIDIAAKKYGKSRSNFLVDSAQKNI
ncbi:MAG: type II toxin-antitoxin system HicB family antitoxin [Desulfobacteraceae bacterium]|nr:type II toxin-antitoxin system HicB family antitoxin [Desulfobacteraceae bacterium]